MNQGWRVLFLSMLAAGVIATGLPATESPSSALATPEDDTSTDAGAAYRHLLPYGVRGMGRAGGERWAHAVRSALAWLVAHQSPDGGWEAAGFAHWCDGKAVPEGKPRPDGAGIPACDPGVTGMSLLAFLGAGYTQDVPGRFGQAVERGLLHLLEIQDDEGCFGPRTWVKFTHGHAYAAQAIIEAFGMTGDRRLREPAQRALDFVALARNPYFAWRYGVKPGDNDTAVTGEMAGVLHSAGMVNASAQRVGLEPPFILDDSAFDGVRAWLGKMTDPDYGRTGYIQRGAGPTRPKELIDRFPGEKSESMTALGMLARLYTGEVPAHSKLLQLGADLCAKLPPTWNPSDGSIDLYYWFVGSQALHQMGGNAWKAWKQALEKAVVEHQRKDTTPGIYRGSWDPIGPWGPIGGRVYATAAMALALEAPTRFPVGFLPRDLERSLVAAFLDPRFDASVRGHVAEAIAARLPERAPGILGKGLRLDQPDVRRHAAEAIGRLGARARPFVPDLLDVLDARDAASVRAALRSLAALGEVAAPGRGRIEALLGHADADIRKDATAAWAAVGGRRRAEGLSRLLADPDPGVRVAAARGMWKLTREAEPLLPVLTACLEAEDAADRVAALEALTDLDQASAPALEAVTKRLVGEDPRERLLSAELLVRVGGSEALSRALGGVDTGLDALIDASFASPDPFVRLRAVRLVGALGSAGTTWAPQLRVALFREGLPAVRVAALRALARVSPSTAEDVALIHLAAQTGGRAVVEAARDELERSGVSAAEVIPLLHAALGRTADRSRAARALAALGPSSVLPILTYTTQAGPPRRHQVAVSIARMGAAAVPELVRALDHESPQVRELAIRTLARMGQEAAPAAPALVAAFEDEDQGNATRARAAMRDLGPLALPADRFPHVDQLRSDLESTDPMVRSRGAASLASIGDAARPALAELAVLLGDSEEDVAALAVNALAGLGNTAVPVVSRVVQEGSGRARLRAIETFARMDPPPQDAIPVLAVALRDAKLSPSAAKALARQGRPAVLELRHALSHPLPIVRRSAADALGAIGAPAASAVYPLLALAMKKEEPQPVKDRVWIALGRIGRAAIPALEQALRHEDRNISRRAAQTLRIMRESGAGRRAQRVARPGPPPEEGRAYTIE